MIELQIEIVVEFLSIYMFITFIGLAIGTLLLNFNKPEQYEPFILISLAIFYSIDSHTPCKTISSKIQKNNFYQN